MARGSGTLRWLTAREYDGRCHLQTDYMRLLLENVKCMYRKDLFAHYGCVNAIEFSSDGEWLSSGGDDRRVLLWNIRRTLSLNSQPHIMKGEHNSNIFCLGFDNTHSKIFSAGNDEQVVIHNIESGETLDVFLHEDAVYGLSVDPFNSSVFASACDNGQILIWDTRDPATNNPFILAQSSSAFHAVVYNPAESRILATANAREGISLWDIRKPRSSLLSFGGCFSAQSSMSVRFSRNGMRLLALRRRLPPVLYNISSPCPVMEFDHPGYYNSCTMKSCTFAGDDDQFVMSGSDDFKLYMWRIPPDCGDRKGLWINTAHLVLKGHRSIVNQVRYSPVNSLIASSGVEKVVKLWSLIPLPHCHRSNERSTKGRLNGSYTQSSPLISTQVPRHVYSHEEYINLVLESGQFMTHDYSQKSMNEDPRMMAFFDSLVQRDIEGWTSDSSESSVEPTETTEPADKDTLSLEVQSSASSSSPSSSSSDSDGDSSNYELSLPVQDKNFAPQTLSYITTLTNRVEANLLSLQHQNNGDSSESDEINRISQLIARKRHEQLLRTARSTVRLTQKRLRQTKYGDKFVVHANKIMDVEEKTLDGVRKILDTVLLRQTGSQDLRKIRQSDFEIMRRGREHLRQSLSESSDQSSDDVSATNTVLSLTGNSSNECVDESLSVEADEDNTPSQNGTNDDRNCSHSTDHENNVALETYNNENHESKKMVKPGPVPTGDSVQNVSNGNSEEAANGSRFKSLNNRHSKRNYRMQNQQDKEDND